MTEPSPFSALMQLVNGYQVSQAVHVVATLGIADLLRDGSRSSDELATASGAHPNALYRVLRALAAVGVFKEEDDRRFALTPVGACLRSVSRETAGPWASFIGRPYYWHAWGELLHSVQTGENAFQHLHGTDVWRYRAAHPEESAIFDRAMTGISYGIGDAVAQRCDFSGDLSLVDIGGGQGAFLARILAENPQARGILFDQPHVVARAEGVLHAAGVLERCDVVGGDFFQAVPRGGDVYLLKAVLHDWYDPEAVDILRACRRAMDRDARLMVVDAVIAPPNEGAAAKFADLNMLVAPGGQERTREEFSRLFDVAGFQLTQVIETGTRMSVIEGRLA